MKGIVVKMHLVLWMNNLHIKNGISEQISPRAIVVRTNLDLKTQQVVSRNIL